MWRRLIGWFPCFPATIKKTRSFHGILCVSLLWTFQIMLSHWFPVDATVIGKDGYSSTVGKTMIGVIFLPHLLDASCKLKTSCLWIEKIHVLSILQKAKAKAKRVDSCICFCDVPTEEYIYEQ